MSYFWMNLDTKLKKKITCKLKMDENTCLVNRIALKLLIMYSQRYSKIGMNNWLALSIATIT
jgi:hypothetical protein